MACISESHLTIQRVKGVAGIVQEDGLSVLFREDGPHCVDSSLDAGSLTSAELLCAGSIHEISFGGKQDSLCDDPPWCFTYPDGSDTGTLVNGNQTTG